MNESTSCVETTKAPEWLHKLEERREKLKGRLGHEIGSGAKCSECGDKCPGLDLHFWRKVCRNCKCRKDQHLCQDDDLSGWAQFEILGQIRSKSAFIKINALAAEPIKLDWIPPNAPNDVINDYMEKLGEKQIPISGSDAAVKRKQQLEFQVPPHDLDARLCDNLTESESQQLEQYVRKIRDNCVGQGNVIRINPINHNATVLYVNPEIQNQIAQKLDAIPSRIVNDKVLSTLLNSEKLSNALLNPAKYSRPLNLIAFMNPLQSENPINIDQTNLLSRQTKEKLKSLQINFPIISSLIQNGPIYDKILNEILSKNLNISNDPVLQTIQDFRQEYLTNDYFRNDLEEFLCEPAVEQYATPLKQKINPEIFNSPLAVRNPIQPKTSSLMQQETPVRKINFGNKTPLELLSLPVMARIEKDKIIEHILSSEPLKHALQNQLNIKNLVINQAHVLPDFDFILPLSDSAQMKLDKIGLNNKNCIQSGYVNGAFYDKLFNNLKSRGINFGSCKLLEPIAEYRVELINDPQFNKEIGRLIQKLPNDVAIFENLPINSAITSSNSSDSGFVDPPTPNYSTFPGSLGMDNTIEVNPGKFSSIPLIEDLNMYPNLNLPSDHSREMQEINKNLTELQLNENFQKHPVPVLNCKDCNEIIFSGDVAVKAERAGHNISWHPECFRCHKCRELLADLVYFFHEDNVYCGRDLAVILKIPRCKACDELIFTKEYTAAENSTFHIKHFCCFHCDLPLAGKKYVPDEKTNMPICLDCYDEYYAAKCQLCLGRIGPQEQGVSWKTIHWHAACFKCAGLMCGGKSLIGNRFCVKENLPFCSPQCVKSVIN